MRKRKSSTMNLVDGNDDEATTSTKRSSQRTNSSSSSTSGEWLCCASSTRLTPQRQRNEVSELRPAPRAVYSAASRRSPWFRRAFAVPHQAGSAAKEVSSKEKAAVDIVETSKIEESPVKICRIPIAAEQEPSESKRSFRDGGFPHMTSARLESLSKIIEESPVKKCCTPTTTERRSSESKSYVDLNLSQLKNATLETLATIEESPVKTCYTPKVRRPSRSTLCSPWSSSTVADSQRTPCLTEARSFKNGQPLSSQSIRNKKAGTWPFCATVAVQAKVSPDLVNPVLSDSSPEICAERLGKSPSELRTITASTNSTDEVIASTQNVVTESDGEEFVNAEQIDVDENSGMHSKNPSTEKKSKYDPADESGSSDEDDTVTRKSLIKKNLTGITRDFADYLLSIRSERVMARSDKSLPTFTYEVVNTVSAWGFSISWLSPKAIMYAKPFARDPSSVTLVLPIEDVIADPSDPETPMFVNPIIVAIGREVTASDSTNK